MLIQYSHSLPTEVFKIDQFVEREREQKEKIKGQV